MAVSARELHDSISELKAFLDQRGHGADPVLKEKLQGVSDQLAAVFLDSDLEAREMCISAEEPESAPEASAPETFAPEVSPPQACVAEASAVETSTPEASVPEAAGSRHSANRNGSPGTVKLHVDASMLRGSAGTFRDAQVDFEERQVVVRAVDRSGRTWTLRSARLPGPIATDKSRFQLGKTGKDLNITLKKANVDDVWHQDRIKLSEEGLWKKSLSRSSRSSASQQGAASCRVHDAAPDAGSFAASAHKEQGRDARDWKKLGDAFI